MKCMVYTIMVKTVELTVTDGYALPASIATLTPSSTVLYLDCIDGLLTEYAGTANELDANELTSALELKYHKLESGLVIKHKNLMRASMKKHGSVVTEYEEKIKELQDTVDGTDGTIQRELDKAKIRFDKELKGWKETQNRTVALERECVEHEQKLKSQMILADLNVQNDKNDKLQLELKSVVEEKESMAMKYREQLEQEKKQITDNITEQVILTATQQIKSDLAVAHNTIEHLKEQNKEHQLTINNSNELYKSMVSEKDTIDLRYREQASQDKEQLEQERKQIADNITEQVRLTVEQRFKSDLAVAHNTIEHLKEQNKEHQLTINNSNELYKSMVSEKSYMSMGFASTDKTMKDLSEQIQPIINMYTGSNEEKGTAGEQTVMNILMEPKYESAKVFDTSGEAACGDIHFHWNDLRCLIEVKNKKTITLEDMKKFERDVRNCKESNKNINCAIFVSLCSGQYPGRSRETIQLDMINNVPVIYTYIANLDMLHYSIMCLNNLVKNTKTDSHTMETLMSYYNGYAKHVGKSITYFSKLIKSHETNIKSLKKEINQLTILDEDLASNTELYQVQEVSDLLIDEDEEDSLDMGNEEKTEPLDLTAVGVDSSIDRVVDYYINQSLTQKKNPSIVDVIRHFNITTNILLRKLGGIKAIALRANKKYMTNMVSNDVVRRLKLYKIANGGYPKRVELIRDYISHRQLVKIGYVFKGKKIMEAVYAHVENESVVDSVVEVEVEVTESEYETDDDEETP
jgi:hypothetical protein